jgi:hypothetical protein
MASVSLKDKLVQLISGTALSAQRVRHIASQLNVVVPGHFVSQLRQGLWAAVEPLLDDPLRVDAIALAFGIDVTAPGAGRRASLVSLADDPPVEQGDGVRLASSGIVDRFNFAAKIQQRDPTLPALADREQAAFAVLTRVVPSAEVVAGDVLVVLADLLPQDMTDGQVVTVADFASSLLALFKVEELLADGYFRIVGVRSRLLNAGECPFTATDVDTSNCWARGAKLLGPPVVIVASPSLLAKLQAHPVSSLTASAAYGAPTPHASAAPLFYDTFNEQYVPIVGSKSQFSKELEAGIAFHRSVLKARVPDFCPMNRPGIDVPAIRRVLMDKAEAVDHGLVCVTQSAAHSDVWRTAGLYKHVATVPALASDSKLGLLLSGRIGPHGLTLSDFTTSDSVQTLTLTLDSFVERCAVAQILEDLLRVLTCVYGVDYGAPGLTLINSLKSPDYKNRMFPASFLAYVLLLVLGQWSDEVRRGVKSVILEATQVDVTSHEGVVSRLGYYLTTAFDQALTKQRQDIFVQRLGNGELSHIFPQRAVAPGREPPLRVCLPEPPRASALARLSPRDTERNLCCGWYLAGLLGLKTKTGRVYTCLHDDMCTRGAHDYTAIEDIDRGTLSALLLEVPTFAYLSDKIRASVTDAIKLRLRK